MELLVGMYGELIATLMLALAASPFLKKTKLSTKTYNLTVTSDVSLGENHMTGARS